jgi:hypothetical protein
MGIVKALVCDYCGVSYDTDFKHASEVRVRAIDDGWAYLRGTQEQPAPRGTYADICENCRKENG